MSTRKLFLTALVVESFTFFFLTNVFFWSYSYFIITKSTLSCILVLFKCVTCFSKMVRLNATIWAKCIAAIFASNPILTHVYSSFLTNCLPHIIFDVVIDTTFLNLHKSSTWTFPHIRILFNYFVSLTLFNLFQFLVRQILFNLIISNNLTAVWIGAFKRLALFQFLDASLTEALLMNLMPAVRWLN